MSRRRFRSLDRSRPSRSDPDEIPGEELLGRFIANAGSPVAGVLLWALRKRIATGRDDVREVVGYVQAMRDLGTLTPDAAFYLIAILTEEAMIARLDSDARLVALRDRMHAIERASGLGEDEAFRVGEAPEEWKAADTAWTAVFDELWAALLRELGEREMAWLRGHDESRFEERTMDGRAELMGAD